MYTRFKVLLHIFDKVYLTIFVNIAEFNDLTKVGVQSGLLWHSLLPVEWDEHHKPHTAHVADGGEDPHVADVRPRGPRVGTRLCVITDLQQHKAKVEIIIKVATG
jgi:hypothetical protein